MSSPIFADPIPVAERARLSLGQSDSTIYEMVLRALNERKIMGNTILDVGCGAGNLKPYVSGKFKRYIGVDVVRYDGFPLDAEFHQVDMERDPVPLSSEIADVVVSVETIEHLENPRALLRELVRLTEPGGWVIVTTPNQLSFLSLVVLIFKRRFAAFQDCNYPAHRTALLEVDLRRIAQECGLKDVAIIYSLQGRIVLTSWHYPKLVARVFPLLLSDNLLLIGRKPDGS